MLIHSMNTITSIKKVERFLKKCVLLAADHIAKNVSDAGIEMSQVKTLVVASGQHKYEYPDR